MLCIRDANVVDVVRGCIVPNRSVIVEGERIHAVGDSPPNYSGQTQKASGLFVCPGLIDSHVHFFLDGGDAPSRSYIESSDETRMAWAQQNARSAIQAGITTMRDLAAPAPLMFAFQRQVECGEILGPHIISCGYALMRPGGHCHFFGGGEVANVQEVRRLTEHQLQEGACFVKLMASGGGLTPGTVPHEADLSIDLMRAAAEVAHAHGVQITAHCHATESIQRAIDAGLDMIEHVSFVEPPGRYRYDDKLTRRIRDRGIVVSPTASAALRIARRLRRSEVPHNAEDTKTIERLEGRLTNTANFHRLNMKIIGGTDCGVTVTPFNSLVDELLTYTEAGLSSEEALRTATNKSAEFMNLSRIGEIRAGYRADFTLLAGNPFEDLNVLRQPLHVFKSGRLVYEHPTCSSGLPAAAH